MKTQTIRQRLLHSTMIGGAALMAIVAVPAVTMLTPTTAVAQTQTGALRITVTGNDGLPLAGATVTVSSPSSLVTRSGVTDADGRVRIGGLDPATNYTVAVSAPGYEPFGAENVAVISGRDLSVGYVLLANTGNVATVDDIIVTGRSLAAVDVTSATVGTTLTLDIVESLPTGRSYQSYLQLVPGVKPSESGNPSSRSGVNYSDIGGTSGSSSDNVYYIDGVDVTDPTTGTFGANFNSEIIQEQQVIVGGVPAEYAGGSGLISRVITKSGSNEFHGSLNYYLQNDNLVAEDEHNTSGGFSTYDTAVTLGGPILQDRLWFFASYQKKHREDDVEDPNSGALLRSVTNDGEYGFGKVTWQITPDDRLTATFFNDPTEISGSNDSGVLNNRDRAREQGGDNYKIDYSHFFGDLVVNGYFFRHEGQLSSIAADQSTRDNVAFASSANSTLQQRSLGGFGSNIETERNRDEWGINFEYYRDTAWGSHTIKGGFLSTENIYAETSSIPGGSNYASLAAAYAGTTFNQYTTGSWTSTSISASDSGRIIQALNANPTARAAVDTDNNGTVSQAELDAYQFTSTAGNPYGNVNVYRVTRTSNAPYEVRSEGQTLYLQDTWTMDRLTINAGVRAEKWEHFASDGSKVATFDWEIAPRLSAVYDLNGDGRSKVFGFVGRYYDPIRNNMSDFAGALTGPVDEEQIFIGGQWVTFRTRGGTTTPDALFAPSTKTPYTDEFMIGYSTTFGSSVGLSASITRRQTRDILEDFDLSLYSDPTLTAGTAGVGYAYDGSLFYLPYSYFGYSSAPNSNYVIGTLPGGERNYTGFEISLTKFKTDNWQGQVSYTYNDAEGNSNSDSNADFQGDWIALDPRAPNIYGPQPGSIEHQFKAYGSYDFDFGLQVSGVFNWNSGLLYTPSQLVYGRYLPLMGGVTTFGGVQDTYALPNIVGSETGPSYYTFDMRFKYVRDLPVGEAEFFLDIFNVLNNQAATNEEALFAGSGQYAFGEANSWVAPRRAYLGVRFSF
ncbi:TonB-dependent receptor [Brevundimonas sp. A19_0]|uniref:TonB-dependent receptor n=1 Tax=Brevundimonas sp. A19_0 TaxID=2821087 RepID=UPI001AD980FB|nr:TonB-dependent receptor [Brevundimonas sp. A19_0]MBO9501720.1 TonB-dependent receptor [Brevundimonas sp. A19_0]